MTASLNALCLALGLQVSSLDPDFKPALHHGQSSPQEWLGELEASGGTSAGVVWALFYSGDRSEPVIEALTRWGTESKDAETRRAIDTVLVHWGLKTPSLTAAEYAAPAQHVAAPDLFPIPPRLEGRLAAELLQDLASTDVPRIASAAAALVARKERVDEALVALIAVDPGTRAGSSRWSDETPDLERPSGLRRWALDYAGSAYVRALAGGLERATDAERRTALLRALERARGDLGPAASALEPLLEGAGEERRLAKGLWERAVRLPRIPDSGGANQDWALHAFLIDRPEQASPEVQASIARVFGARIERVLALGNVTPEFLGELHVAALASAALAEGVLPFAASLLDREDAVANEALKILCHLRAPTPRARERYLELLAARDPHDSLAPHDLPCWPEHDDETLQALTRFVEGLPDASGLREQLRFAGLLDGTRLPITRRVIEDSSPDGLHWMIGQGFRAKVPLEDDWLPEQRINALAMNLATAAALGEDGSQLEAQFAEVLGRPYDRQGAGGYNDYVQWGFFHARELGLRSDAVLEIALQYVRWMREGTGWDGFDPFSVHTDAAIAYLDTAELSLEDELRVLELLPYDPGGDGWMGLNIVQPVDGGITRRRTAIELVPAMRLALYSGRVRVLADLLAVTRPTERDLDYLLAALQRGRAWDRRSALDLIGECEIESPRLLEAVRAAREDLDDGVSQRARGICAERGW